MSQYIDDSMSFFEDIFEIDLSNLMIKYKVLDDIDFFNECKKETGSDELSDFLIISVPKDEEDCKLLLLINDYVERMQDNYGLEILYSQLSTALINSDEYLADIQNKCRLPFFKNAIHGVEYWKEYRSIYCSQYVMKVQNGDEMDTENPYNDKKALKIGLNFLNKAIIAPDKTTEERISLLLYSFGKIAIIEEEPERNIYDLTPFINNKDLKKPIQELYSILSSKTLVELTILHFIKINLLMEKIKTILNAQYSKKE